MSTPASDALFDELDKPLIVYVLGVAGSGKRTVGPELAGKLQCPYVDGLALLPWRDRAKFDAGHALNVEVRTEWLQKVFDVAIQRLESAPAGRPKRVVVAVAAVKKVHVKLQHGGETAQHIIDEAYKHVPTDPRRHDVRVAYVYLKDDEAPMVNLLHFGVQHLLPKSFARHKSKVEALEHAPARVAEKDLLILSIDRAAIGAAEAHKRTLTDELYAQLHNWLIGKI